MGGEREGWVEIQERLLQGDRLAFLKVNRLITGILTQLRAYDFRDEWDDLRQEVLLSVVANARAGRLRDPLAFVAYVRVITRNTFIDRLKTRLRHHEKEVLPWDEETERTVARDGAGSRDETAEEVWSVVRSLPEQQRLAIEGVYREGKAYQEVADATGIPLGTLKRRLQEGLRALHERLSGGPARK
jgi:RNA polymerase sigma factor (sigma-70 family)